MWLFSLIVIASLLNSTSGCGGGGGGGTGGQGQTFNTPPNEPPTIKCPSVKKVYTADKMLTTTTVKWDIPTATDPNGDTVTVTQKSGKSPGSHFGRGTHTLVYVARDDKGLMDMCMFSFTVEVIQCPVLRYIQYGRVECEGRYYGQTCNFDCEDGYQLVGEKDTECLNTGQWDHSNPQCVAKECVNLPKIPNSINYTCTDGQKVGSVCWLNCDEANGYTHVRRQYTECRANKTWTIHRMECQDVEAPKILNCPTQTLVKSKDPIDTLTHIEFEKPITVEDNSGEELQATTVVDKVTASYGYFKEGVTHLTFTAKDRANNTASNCDFIIRIKGVSCDPPKMDDKYLKTDCEGFREGQSCSLECQSEVELVGPSGITCKKGNSSNRFKGYWDYGQYDSPAVEAPYCNVPSCADLRSPNFGAMSCDKWFFGTMCSISCKNGYDIPESESATTFYICNPNINQWSYDRVPNCAKQDDATGYRLDGYVYFNGSCADVEKEIKENFLKEIDLRSLCKNKENCTVENVSVKCGDEPEDEFEWRRRKRSLRNRKRRLISYIKFEVNVPANKSMDFRESLVNGRIEVTKVALEISHLSFNISSSRQITPIGFRKTYIVPTCEPGFQLGVFNRDACVPCPSGSFHNVTKNKCVACPLGQFQDLEGQIACQDCPAGTTTITVANKEVTACKEKCLPGTYSPRGVVPCSKCPEGSYTSNLNSTSCTLCPTGMTTEEEGADSVSKCMTYDIMLQGPVSSPLDGKTPVQICDFTFAVWIKTAEEANDGVRFEISNPTDGRSLQIEISTTIEVTLNGRHSVRAIDVLDTKWHHVAVIWSQQTMTLYNNNVVVKTQSLPGANKCPSSTDSSMQITIRNYAYVHLRDLNFLAGANPSIIDDMTKTCTSYLADSLFTLEQIDAQSNDRIMEVIPSTCLRPDPCIPNPCGDNVCIPGRDKVTCACKRGYTGPKCEKPPDYCKDNICQNNATCYESDGFACACPPGFAGKLCARKIADGGWSTWYDWSECSISCGRGVQTRFRFCTNPPPDPEGKPCPGSNSQAQQCNQTDCPVCDESTLLLGKGVIKTCTKSQKRISCSIKCKLGKVLPERPFDYVCDHGFWTPTRQTVSCTDPVTPITVGINYTVVYGDDLTSQIEVQNSLNRVGHDFTCARDNTCQLEVGSSVCSQHVPLCNKTKGTYFGSLIVERGVPQAPISVADFQKNENSYLKPLLHTWNVFSHTSDELVTPLHRPLEMQIVGEELQVFPYDHSDQAVTVPGQFGEIMKIWNFLDITNWEVRNDNYTTFKAATPGGERKPLFLSAVQVMTCPPGAVSGGLSCMKCPPGKYYVNEECKWCTHGLYQDLPGQFACKACPAFQTTEDIGSSDVSQCIDTDVSEIHILLGLTSPKIGVLDMTDLNYRQMSMTPTHTGNVDYMAYNPSEKTIFFSTQHPSTISRVEYIGYNEMELITFPDGTVVTGLDVDIGSSLLFYMTNQGVLAAYHIVTGAQWILLSDLPSSNGLVLDQEFGIYWMETDTIVYMQYGDETPRTLYADTHTIWGLTVNHRDKRLMWQSADRLRSSNMNGSEPQTLSLRYSNRFGATDVYFFTIIKEGTTQKLMRENRDLTARVSIHVVPQATSRMKVINTTIPHTVDQPCLPSHSDCQQACLPLNTTARHCFCKPDFTLQSDLKSCRRDFSFDFETTETNKWYRPMRQGYSIPPSNTLRFNVKACHSAKVSLAKTGREQYVLRIDNRFNNKTWIDLVKYSPSRPKVLLKEKEITLLDCNQFKTFWITWKKDEARGRQALKVGYGSVVGSGMQLNVADAFPYTVNFLQFGVGINATANWQI